MRMHYTHRKVPLNVKQLVALAIVELHTWLKKSISQLGRQAVENSIKSINLKFRILVNYENCFGTVLPYLNCTIVF